MGDPYLDEELSKNRLLDEWKKYGKIVIAYDFDDTVYDFHKKGYEYKEVIALIRRCKKIGAYFIIHTACGPDQEDFIKEYLTTNNIPFDSINENCPFVPETTGRKCYYNILLDDRAGLSSAYYTLSYAVRKMEEYKKEKKND